MEWIPHECSHYALISCFSSSLHGARAQPGVGVHGIGDTDPHPHPPFPSCSAQMLLLLVVLVTWSAWAMTLTIAPEVGTMWHRVTVKVIHQRTDGPQDLKSARHEGIWFFGAVRDLYPSLQCLQCVKVPPNDGFCKPPHCADPQIPIPPFLKWLVVCMKEWSSVWCSAYPRIPCIIELDDPWGLSGICGARCGRTVKPLSGA